MVCCVGCFALLCYVIVAGIVTLYWFSVLIVARVLLCCASIVACLLIV